MLRGKPVGPIGPESTRPNRAEYQNVVILNVVAVDSASLSRSLSATRGPDNKDIHYTHRGFFSARGNERSVCFAGSSVSLSWVLLRAYVFVICLHSFQSFRRASAIRDLRALTISSGNAIKTQSSKGTGPCKDNGINFGRNGDFTP